MNRLMIILAAGVVSLAQFAGAQRLVEESMSPMMWGDTIRTGVPFSKDPHVVYLNGEYFMYVSIPPGPKPEWEGWSIGIAKSRDLDDWQLVGEILPQEGCDYERKGLCAPGALVRNDTLHLFYQTYGNGRNDAICHAWSTDGVNFTRDSSNPIFHPAGNWNCGRAIDAEVVFFNNKYYLYSASRTPDYRLQIITAATAPAGTDFSRGEWTQASDAAVMFPVLDWEGECIEAPTCAVHDGKLYMAYAGAYNNCPQQIGLAMSRDGIHFARLSPEPFLPVGKPGSWNSSESGHPHLFSDPVSGRTFLFYQGNNTRGQNWVISKRELLWE